MWFQGIGSDRNESLVSKAIWDRLIEEHARLKDGDINYAQVAADAVPFNIENTGMI